MQEARIKGIHWTREKHTKNKEIHTEKKESSFIDRWKKKDLFFSHPEHFFLPCISTERAQSLRIVDEGRTHLLSSSPAAAAVARSGTSTTSQKKRRERGLMDRILFFFSTQGPDRRRPAVGGFNECFELTAQHDSGIHHQGSFGPPWWHSARVRNWLKSGYNIHSNFIPSVIILCKL